jgi:hypothetical protein
MNCRRSLLVVVSGLLGCGALTVGTQGAEPVPAATDRAPFRVVCFGDSVTGEHPSKRTAYQGQYLKFVDILGLMLEARLGSNAVEVTSSGWAGDRTLPHEGWPGAVARADKDVLAFQPAIAVVLVGGSTTPGPRRRRS